VVSTRAVSIFSCMIGIASLFCLLIIVQYASFRMHTQRLIFLQEHYRVYLQAARSVLEKYGDAGKRELDELLSVPEGIHIFSSDNQDNPVLVINREKDYLKESTISYFKQQRLDSLLHQLRSELAIEDSRVMVADTYKQKKTGARGKRARRSYQHFVPQVDISLVWPIAKSQFWLSAFFGPRKMRSGAWDFHRGIDMAALRGTPVKAAAQGIVIEAKYASGYGNTIVIQHTHKYKTRYAHLDSMAVKVGQRVIQSDVIGYVGATGRIRKMGTDGSHLHFELYQGGRHINPIPFLQAAV
jgi:murein DD-endopeptidase MepM/ murein hydrolase activator NlpD